MSKRVTFDPAQNLDLYFRKRRVGSKEFTFLDSDGGAYDLTGQEFEFRSGFAVTLTVLDNKITVAVTEVQTDVKRDSFFWELYNVTTKRTWLCGAAIFTQDLSAEEGEQIGITILLDGEPVEITINESGSDSVEHFKGGWDASSDTFPGDADTLAADWYVFTIGGTLDGGIWPAKTIATALTDNPGQTAANWRLH